MTDSYEENTCLGQFFFNSLKKYSHRTLLYDSETNEEHTFSKVLSQSIRVALKLKKDGISRKDVISSCTYNQKYSCLPIIASQYLGAICAIFDPSLSSKDIIHLLKLSEPKILFVSEESLEVIENCICEAGVQTNLVVFGSGTKNIPFSSYLQYDKDEKDFKPLEIDESETAAILFSSGTTGFPKGICLSHRTIKHGGLDSFPFTISNKNPIVSLMFATFYWISSYVNLVKCVSNGYATVFCKAFDPILTWQLIEKYKVTLMFLAPYQAIACFKEKPKNADCSSVEVLIIGGCPVSENLMNDLKKYFKQAKVLNMYGQTEFGGTFSGFNPLNEEEYNMQLKKPLSCGFMKKHVEWKVSDVNSGHSLGHYKEGELRVRSKYQMNGYYKMDSSSAFDSDGYLKTGDVAFYDEENCFYIVDRVKEMFKYKGWHIVPAVVEEVLTSHPDVSEATVIGVPHKEDGFHPMGVIVLHETNADVQAILDYANLKLSENQKLRAGLKVLESLPKTVTGKIKKLELQKMILNSM